MNFDLRRKLLSESLAQHGLDSFLVTALPNIEYLTGFNGSNGLLLLGPGKPVLLTDPRYQVQASQQTSCTNCKVQISRVSLHRAASALIRRKRLKQIGFEGSRTTFALHQNLSEALPLGAELVSTGSLVENLRAVKDEDEIRLIRQSVQTCSKAFSRCLRRIRPGLKEHELAAELEHQMRRLGAQRASFETIVASGERTALPHAEPTAKPLKTNELLLIDMGAQQHGYASDMTRMLHLGRPSRKAKQLHAAVLEAQLAALDTVKDNIPASRVDRAARGVLRSHGLDRYFVHSTGHGLGLEIHEAPRIGKGEKARLKTGMVITIEPGVYMDGFGGIRIEDTVVVTGHGCQVLTPTPKELCVI